MEHHSPLTQHCRGFDDTTMQSVDGHRSKLIITLDSQMSDPPPTSLAIEDTVYRGEGNANIVIALPQERSVIRFRKSLPGEVSPDGGGTRVQREVGYARNVISCFLGSYMRIPEVVRYNTADIVKLLDAIRSLRPAERRHKTTTDTYATKFPDYAFLDLQLELDQTVFRSRSTFCVEIKPKQGYLHKAEQRIPRCPYCLNQYAKLRKKNIAARSNYCPFDLFSGVEARMRTAVKELLRSPQNNLKIFKDGFVVYDQTSSPTDLESVLNEWFRNAAATATSSSARTRRTDEFCNLVCAALTRPLARDQLELFPAAHPRNFLLPANQIPTFCAEPGVVARAERCLCFAEKSCNFDGDALPVDSVLERIWNMQRLSYINTNYIYNVYSKFAPLLNNDVIYSDLTRLEACVGTIPSSANHTNAIIQKTATEEVNIRTETVDVMTKYSDDSNGNHGDSECIISTNAGRAIVNGGFALQTKISLNDSHRPFYANRRLHNQEVNDDGRKANTRITAEHLSALQNYLLFTTARDCSILMSFRELHPENVTKVPEENTIKLSEQLYFLSSVRVSDLEPKNVHSIKKHRQRDMDIFDSVIFLLEGDNSGENR